MKSIVARFKRFFDASFGILGAEEKLGIRAPVMARFSYVLLIGALITTIASGFAGDSTIERSELLPPGLVAAVALLGNVFLLRITHNVRLVASFSVFIIFVLFSYILLSGQDSGRLIFWFFQFIIFTFLLTGVRQGILWLLALISVFLLVIRLSDLGYLDLQYDTGTIFSFFTTLGVTTVLIYIYESSIEKYAALIKKEQAKTMERNAQYSALITSLGDGLFATDKDGRIQFVNEPGLALIGVSSLTDLENVIGQKIEEVVELYDDRGKRISPDEWPVYEVLKAGRRINTKEALGNYSIKRLDGQNVSVDVMISPIAVSGATTGTVILLHDATSEHEIDRTRSEFVSLASHQLRTPITAINWYTEMLLKGKAGELNPEQRELMDKVYSGSQNMTELVGALLDVSRLELGTFEMRHEQVDILKSLKAVVDNQQLAVQQKHQHLSTDFSLEACHIEGEDKFIQMIFDNLLSNAIKYTDEGGHIQLKAAPIIAAEAVCGHNFQKDGIVITVKDDGFGIPREEQDKVFSKMFRAENVRRTDVHGTGLGLYLVRLIIKELGGSIWFESAEGEGSTFYVYLPTIKVHRPIMSEQKEVAHVG